MLGNPRGNSGCLVASLEAELFPPSDALYQTLMVHGLFSRCIGLSNSHALDNPRVRALMRENETILQTEEVDDRKSPLFAICGRTGANLREAVDLYLKPKGPRNRPTYLSSLSPANNARLAERYSQLRDPEERWLRFQNVVGTDFVEHVARATRYFEKHAKAVLTAVRDRGFFDSARPALAKIDRNKLSASDLRILDAMLLAMDRWNPAEGYQSRERLHEAIYMGKPLPRVWKGRVQTPSYEISELASRNAWRYLVDVLSNEHHAEVYGLGVVTTPNLRIPAKLRMAIDRRSQKPRANQIEVKLPARVYTQYLDMQFVIDIRRKPEFWDSLETFEYATDITAALGDHLKVISEAFARYLTVEKKQPDLVHTTKAKIITRDTDFVFALSTPGVAAIAWAYGLPDLATGILKFGAGAGAATHIIIDQLFSSKSAVQPAFTSFMTDLGHLGEVVVGA